MPPKTFIEPLPRYKVIAFLVILILGISILIASAFYQLQGTLTTIALGLSTSFIAVALVELVPEFFRWRQQLPERRKAEHFFGKEGMKNEFNLVSAERTVEREFLKHLFAQGAPDEYKNDQDKTMKALPEGVRSWIAEQDIRAASYIAILFEDQHIRFRIGIDKDAQNDVGSTSLIALGLGFNACTNKLAELRFDGPLFTIGWEVSPLEWRLGKTDQLIFDGSQVELTEDDKKNNMDYALIARIVAHPGSGRVQFVCAGRSANGTAAAGYFLAQKWDKLAALYDNEAKMDTHSLAVLIRHKSLRSDGKHLDSDGYICRSVIRQRA